MDNKCKHLTLDQRIIIQSKLDEGESCVLIAEAIEKNPTTVKREVDRGKVEIKLLLYHNIMILRAKYLNAIIPFIDTKLIKFLIGVRQSGKRVLLNQIKDYIINKGIFLEHTVYINFEFFINRKYKAAEPLCECIS
ncbi:MAG: helix-turn-helix domain-containing protein [Christensenellaceae bacterium]|nr:helix-turn-helix domain-containing protein [Christensenellaceae bacterium]